MRVYSSRIQSWLLGLILALGLVLRLAGLHWEQGYEFNSIGDEIEAYKVGMQFQAGESHALYLGQPNFKHGKVPGPLWAMVWAAGLRLGGGPEGVIWIVLALNTAVIWLGFILGKKLFDATHGLWAALLLATSPWPVYFSVGCTNPEMMAFLGVLLYLALWAVVRQSRSPHIFGVVVILAIMPQFHMFGVFLFPPVLLLLLLRRRDLNWRWLAAGLAVAGLLYAPYVWGESQTGWANTRRLLGEGEKFSWGSFKAISTTVMSLTNLIESAVGHRWAEYKIFGDSVCGSFFVLAAFNALSIGLSGWILGSFAGQCGRALHGKWRSLHQALAAAPAHVFIGALVFLPLLLFIPTGASFNSRYVIGLYPLLFLLPAVLLATTRHRRLVAGALVTTVVFNLWLCLAFFRYQDHRIAHANYFIPSFRQLESVYQQLQTGVGPTAHPQLVATGFPANRDALPTHGADTLVNYVNLRSQFDHPGTPRQLIIVPSTNPVNNLGRVLYQGHGIAAIAPP